MRGVKLDLIRYLNVSSVGDVGEPFGSIVQLGAHSNGHRQAYVRIYIVCGLAFVSF